jgi:hypothetical protein
VLSLEQPTLPPAAEVTGPDVYNLPAAEYHARLELSSTGARKLLPPSCPALFKHWREKGEQPTDAFDFGSAAHRLVLGVGEEIAEVQADNWRSPKHRDEADEHRAAGRIPLLSRDVGTVHEMAEKLREHPIASALFEPGSGRAEQTLIWRESGTWVEDVDGEAVPRAAWVPCRALVDWLRHPGGGRLLVPDYKTCASAAPADVEKAIARYGYHIQGAFYLAGLRALGRADDSARFLLVMQEKTAPYLVTVIEPDDTAMRMGAIRVRQALDIYAQCTATGRWPGYADDVVLAELPPWETKELKGEIW